MKPSDLEKYADKSLTRLDGVAEKHIDGKLDDKPALVQAGVANAISRTITTDINCRRQSAREISAAMAVA